MKISVVRSGGFAGLSLTWAVQVDEQSDPQSWTSLIEDLPWHTSRHQAPAHPDRYVYRIRVSRRRITLAEQEVTGPWRELVEKVREAARPER